MKSLINEPDMNFHLKLNDQSFHIPYELLQKNIKQTNKLIERETQQIQENFKKLNDSFESNSLKGDQDALQELNSIIKGIDTFEKTLKKRVSKELEILDRIKARVQFFETQEQLTLKEDRDCLLYTSRCV